MDSEAKLQIANAALDAAYQHLCIHCERGVPVSADSPGQERMGFSQTWSHSNGEKCGAWTLRTEFSPHCPHRLDNLIAAALGKTSGAAVMAALQPTPDQKLKKAAPHLFGALKVARSHIAALCRNPTSDAILRQIDGALNRADANAPESDELCRPFAAAPELYEAAEPLACELGYAEWASPEQAEGILSRIIEKLYPPLRAALSKATGAQT